MGESRLLATEQRLRSLIGGAPLGKVRGMNNWFNSFNYRKEQRDHWAAPAEFIAAGEGDSLNWQFHFGDDPRRQA